MAQEPICTKTFRMNNGAFIPAVGLGSWQGRLGTDDETALEESIIHTLQGGYRLIDTAQYYGIESVVGRAIRNSGVQRSEICVVTKFWGNYHDNVGVALEISLEICLRELSIDYIDIFLMHWPLATTP